MLHQQAKAEVQAVQDCLTLKIKAKILENVIQRHSITIENLNLQQNYCKNLKSCIPHC